MFRTNKVAEARYAALLAARAARLDAAFKIAPHTGHKVGHRYVAA